MNQSDQNSQLGPTMKAVRKKVGQKMILMKLQILTLVRLISPQAVPAILRPIVSNKLKTKLKIKLAQLNFWFALNKKFNDVAFDTDGNTIKVIMNTHNSE